MMAYILNYPTYGAEYGTGAISVISFLWAVIWIITEYLYRYLVI